MKKILAKDCNVVILFGDGAIGNFADLVNCWSRMLSPGQWNGFQFILVGSKPPTAESLETIDKSLVNNHNTRFFSFADPVISSAAYQSIIFDKINTGTVRLHIVCDSGKKETDYQWLQELIRSAVSTEVFTTYPVYYLLFDTDTPESEREQMIQLMEEGKGSCFLLGNTNENGGRVTAEERRHALNLAILLNSSGNITVVEGVYSLGYSALNANGTELRQLCESAACRAMLEELGRPVETLNVVAETLNVLPEGVSSPSDFHHWLEGYIEGKVPQPTSVARKNAFITIRMNSELSPSNAVQRMKRFMDLNYTGSRSTADAARELAWQTERTILNRLRSTAMTANLSDRVLEDIAEAFRRLTLGDIQPGGCVYPKKPLLAKFGKQNEEYERQCRDAVSKPMKAYMIQKNISIFAAELEKVYRRLAAWVRKAQGNDGEYAATALERLKDRQRDIDSSDAGNALRLAMKYKNYAAELANMHPHLSTLLEGTEADYYEEDATIVPKSWDKLVQKAGSNIEKRLPVAYRGRFFQVLTAEFSTEEEREHFIEEYLHDGARMYQNFNALKSPGTHVLLADDSLTDLWVTDQAILTVKTDNAENLTVYPLGSSPAAEYLKDPRIYFKGQISGGTGGDLFGSMSWDKVQPAREAQVSNRALFGRSESTALEDPEAESKPNPCGLRLMPDKKNNYRLYWDWRGNDATAMVEMTHYGEKVGKISVIPVAKFKGNGDNMNVTDDIMGGKPLPAGILTVTIRDANHNIYIDSVDVPGRRDVVRYKVSGNRLEIKAENSSVIEEKLVLQTTDTNGTITYYPLYRGDGERPWLFEGLTLSDGKLVEDPTGDRKGQIIPINVDN